MSDTTKTPRPTDDARNEALSWLAGRFRWESLLADLHELAQHDAAPVVELEHHPDHPDNPDNPDRPEDAEDAA